MSDSETEQTIRRVLEQACAICADYMAESRSANVGAARSAPLSETDARIPDGAPDTKAEDLPKLLRSYLNATPRTDHVGFANQLYGGFTLGGIVGELAAAVASTTVATYEAGPAATQIEVGLVHKVMDLAGIPREGSDGVVTSGGSQSNLVGLLLARHWKEPRAKEQGLSGLPRLVAFVSSQAHYSFACAANQLGIGTANMRCVPCGLDGRMLPAELEAAVKRSREAGEVPFFVVCTAGTTVLGAFDPIREISAIAKRYNLWLHVDGAWGGPILLSKKHRVLMDGVSEADSFSMDVHKLMSVPLTCSVVVTRHGPLLAEACSSGNRTYLFHSPGCVLHTPDQGVKSIACGRRPDAVKAWMSWKVLGDDGYERDIDRVMGLASLMASLVRSSAHLELLNDPPQFLNVCFRYNPRDGAWRDLNRLNVELRTELVSRGFWLVNYAAVGESVCIRFVFTNLRLSEQNVRSLLATCEEIGDAIVKRGEHDQPIPAAGRVSPSLV